MQVSNLQPHLSDPFSLKNQISFAISKTVNWLQARVTFNPKTEVGLRVFSMIIHRNDKKYLAPFDCYITFHPCSDGIKIQNYGDVSLRCVCMLTKAAWRFVLKKYRWFKCFAKIQHSFDNILNCLVREVFWHFSVTLQNQNPTECWRGVRVFDTERSVWHLLLCVCNWYYSVSSGHGLHILQFYNEMKIIKDLYVGNLYKVPCIFSTFFEFNVTKYYFPNK